MLLALPTAQDRRLLWPAAVQHAAWCSKMAAQGRRVQCPAFGDVVSARIKDVPKDMTEPRAHDALFIGVDPEAAWLVARLNPKPRNSEEKWIIEATSSFVPHSCTALCGVGERTKESKNTFFWLIRF